MNRFVVGACAVALLTLPAPSRSTTTASALDSRALPMHFEYRVEGPAEACGNACRILVSATGAITSETPRDFEAFAKNRKIRGATLVLDSDGGSVLGAMALGRLVRKLEMNTTVGKLIDLPPAADGTRRAKLRPRAYCESMCAFVLLAGVERYVPAESRVLVHQIWLGDRRDDPTAASYSAEDLVLVQRDIGRLAQYTVEMGGGIDLLETALKIPPWEPMRELTREELRGMKIVTLDAKPSNLTGVTTPTPVLASGSRTATGDRSWVLAEAPQVIKLTRKHPLTYEGDDIGSFELSLDCGEVRGHYRISYIERRRAGETGTAPEPLTKVEISVAGRSVPLKVLSSAPPGQSGELHSLARGLLPAELLKVFAEPRSRSLTVETSSAERSTMIRVGNAGLARSFKKFAAYCSGPETIRSTQILRTDKIAADQPR